MLLIWYVIWFWYTEEIDDGPTASVECGDYSFEFGELTVGQVAAASSAAAGGGAVHVWVQNVIEITRRAFENLAYSGGGHLTLCKPFEVIFKSLLGKCGPQSVITEFLKLLGCRRFFQRKENSAVTAARWAGFLRKMAVKMPLSDSQSRRHVAHMAIDAVSTHEMKTDASSK